MDYLLSIDIGTTSTKGVAFAIDGTELFKHTLTYPLHYPKPGFAEQDPDQICQAALDCLHLVHENCKNSGTLLGVSFSAAMHSLLCVNEDGLLLTPLLTWADNRSAPQAQALRNTPTGMEIYHRTGTPVHAMSPLCKLLWLARHEPEVFKDTHKYIGIKEYLWFALFGKYECDVSVASATGLFDFHTFQWSELALQTAGISQAQLPELVSVYHTRPISQHWAGKLGIPAGTPFVVGGSDGVLANLGAGALDETCLSVTIGTSGAVRITTRKPLTDRQMRTFCYVLDKGHFVVGGGMNNGGIIAEWMQKQLFPQRLTQTPADLMQLAQHVPVGSDGLVFLPYLLGERSPLYDASAKGMFFGITMAHSQAHFVRAVLEGILLAVFSIGKVLFEDFTKVEKIYAGGGFAHSAFWVKMLADVFGKPVWLAPSAENSALGAALIARKALGLTDALENFSFPPPDSIFEPDLEKHRVYQQRFEKFTRLYQKLKDEF